LRSLLIYLVLRFCAMSAVMFISVAAGWQIYSITDSALSLGLVGLAQFVPLAALSWAGGDAADRYDRRLVLGLAYLADGAAALALVWLTLIQADQWAFFAVLAVFGAARAFAGPAASAILPRIAPPELLPRAIAWNSMTFQFAVIGGPAIAGFLLLWGADVVYGVSAVLFAIAIIGTQVLTLSPPPAEHQVVGSAWTRAMEGLQFVKSRPVILGAISLDLFAVLFGGVTALLPIFAKDILFVGPDGLGLLRSAPAIGAAAVSILLGVRPLTRFVGPAMFACVAIYGVFTIVFALSALFWLSLACLMILGAADMISVYVRQSLIQLQTPDHMRGRVSAVSMLFISASNEFGEFESGLMAWLMGAVTASIVGGVGTLVIVAAWMALFPQLRRVDRIDAIVEK
jgi:MFS family permease